MEIKHVLVPRWLLKLKYSQVSLTLFYLIPLFLYHYNPVEHVVSLEVEKEVNNCLIRVVYYGHNQRGQSNAFAILVCPVPVQTVEISFKIESALLYEVDSIENLLSL